MQKEQLRIRSVKKYLQNIAGTSSKLQDIVALASQITGVPVAFITLIDKDIQWINVKHGFEVDQMPRSTSFCTHTIEQDEVMVVPDAIIDSRFLNNPLVINPPSVKYYAGIALKSAEGQNVGTLCVMDIETHNLNNEQLNALKALSKQVTNIMELSIIVDHLKKSITEIEERNTALKKIAQVQSHEIRGPLTSIMGVMDLMKTEANNLEYFGYLETAVSNLDEKIKLIVDMSSKAHSYNVGIGEYKKAG